MPVHEAFDPSLRIERKDLLVGVDGQFGCSADVGGEERRAKGHRFEERKTVPLVVARPDEAQRTGVEPDQILVGRIGMEHDARPLRSFQ